MYPNKYLDLPIHHLHAQVAARRSAHTPTRRRTLSSLGRCSLLSLTQSGQTYRLLAHDTLCVDTRKPSYAPCALRRSRACCARLQPNQAAPGTACSYAPGRSGLQACDSRVQLHLFEQLRGSVRARRVRRCRLRPRLLRHPLDASLWMGQQLRW